MPNVLEEIVLQMDERDPLHAKKVRKNIERYDEQYFQTINEFLGKYMGFLNELGKDLGFALDCYDKWLQSFRYEHLRFIESGHYSSSSFDEVYERVYNNPEVMEWYMHGLLLSQALWDQHYVMFSFFLKSVPKYKGTTRSYLEVGAGHGLFLSEAKKVFNPDTEYDVVDISPTSIEIAKKFTGEEGINFILSDIFKYEPNRLYDFITIGEVLEHLEDPLALLKKLRDMLSDDGVLFLTVPANAPTMDHIYLFKNADEIRELINQAGFNIVDEVSTYAEDVSKEKAEKFKVTLEYGAFIKKRT